jgi:hypothetical protein
MNDPTPLMSPNAHEGLAINHQAQPAPSRALLHLRMGLSPRANVALSFLRSLEWLRTKLHAIFSRSIPVQARSPALPPDYARRQVS